ncbi:hypothetical protein GWK47_017152 [Chionoecetes opilio]|uniref:Reverse transcriptase domain-containing protein n=1 Tax=Chionoecetes opilio TaxID=41210 RepID=A0A8J4XW61_CHIOP|nr:hypothetical protein GWK47_017152 [Chionoecetes opilio]
MNWVLGKVVDQSDCGTSLGNTKITDLVFADDAVIFAESLEVLVMALDVLHEEAKPLGLEVSWLKTKVQVDKDIINEYLTVMKPGVTNLNKFQIERETFMGVLLPTLSVPRDILRALKAMPFKSAQSFLEYLLKNPLSDKRPKIFKARFLSVFDNMNLLMAIAIHHLFKLSVVRLLNPEKEDAVKSRLLFEITEQAVLDSSEGQVSPDHKDEDEDFIKPFRTTVPTDKEGTNSTRLSNKMGKKLESWCLEKKNKLLEQAMLPTLSCAAWMMCLLSTKRPNLALQLWINCSPKHRCHEGQKSESDLQKF